MPGAMIKIYKPPLNLMMTLDIGALDIPILPGRRMRLAKGR